MWIVGQSPFTGMAIWQHRVNHYAESDVVNTWEVALLAITVVEAPLTKMTIDEFLSS